MNPNESWLAEQARLLMQEEGFGPASSSRTGGASGAATGSDEGDAASGRSGA